MRSCIYCGRELQKGEVCSCPQSVRARAAKEAKSGQETEKKSSQETGEQRFNAGAYDQTTYRTGYTKTKKEPFFKKHKKKKKARKLHHDHGAKTFFAELKDYMVGFIKDPVNSVVNGAYLGKLQIIVIMLLQSFIVAFTISFASVRMVGRYTRMMLSAGVNPIIGYNWGSLFLDALLGTIFICGGLFLLIGIFYLIHRYLFKQKGGFWDFSIRLAASSIPLCLMGILGILAGLFSPYAMLILVIGGAAVWLVLIYESLCAEWSFMPKGRILYIMVIGILIFLTAIMNFVRFFG